MSKLHVSQDDLMQIARTNHLKAEIAEWLDKNARQIFTEKHLDVEFIAVTKAPPTEDSDFHVFKDKENLLAFMQTHPSAAFCHRGFEEEIYML